MIVTKKKEKTVEGKGVSKKEADFLKGFKLLEEISVVCESKWDGKLIQARIHCAKGATVNSVLQTVAGVMTRVLERVQRS